MAKRLTKRCKCKYEYYIRDGETLCDSCLLEKFGLGLSKKVYSVSEDYNFDYYEEEDVVKALRKASGL